MSVVIETTIGDLTVDLYLKERPNTCLNFLKLCKIKHYNLCLFHKVERNFIAQTGDPTGTGRGGESVFCHLYGDQAKYFDAELKPRLKHEKLGTLSMVNNGNNMNGSQFFLTLGENLTYLDEVHTVFGEVAEGFDILSKINEAICDDNNRPYQDIRITHTVVLHDPYDDPAGLDIPDASPEPTREQLESNYIGADEEIDDTKGKSMEEIEEKIKDSEAKARATILEMVGDIPDVDVKPPDNVLFVCKLNPVTTSEDLEIIFSRFGPITSCEVIKDKKTGESLQYAFIEFEKEEDCENAYFKMDNVLIDDRRIHVDFSQSVSKLNWDKERTAPNMKKPRGQEFVIKSNKKKSDGYDMIFDLEDNRAEKSVKSKEKRSHKSRTPENQHRPSSTKDNSKRRYQEGLSSPNQRQKELNSERKELSSSIYRDTCERKLKNSSSSKRAMRDSVDKDKNYLYPSDRFEANEDTCYRKKEIRSEKSDKSHNSKKIHKSRSSSTSSQSSSDSSSNLSPKRNVQKQVSKPSTRHSSSSSESSHRKIAKRRQNPDTPLTRNFLKKSKDYDKYRTRSVSRSESPEIAHKPRSLEKKRSPSTSSSSSSESSPKKIARPRNQNLQSNHDSPLKSKNYKHHAHSLSKSPEISQKKKSRNKVHSPSMLSSSSSEPSPIKSEKHQPSSQSYRDLSKISKDYKKHRTRSVSRSESPEIFQKEKSRENLSTSNRKSRDHLNTKHYSKYPSYQKSVKEVSKYSSGRDSRYRERPSRSPELYNNDHYKQRKSVTYFRNSDPRERRSKSPIHQYKNEGSRFKSKRTEPFDYSRSRSARFSRSEHDYERYTSTSDKYKNASSSKKHSREYKNYRKHSSS